MLPERIAPGMTLDADGTLTIDLDALSKAFHLAPEDFTEDLCVALLEGLPVESARSGVKRVRLIRPSNN